MKQAYKGYLICENWLGEVTIQKDGYLIAHALSVDAAKEIIDDNLVSTTERNGKS